MIQQLLEITSSNKLYSNEIAYADDFTVAGSIKGIKCYWEHLNSFATFSNLLSKSIKIPPYSKKSTQLMLSLETLKLS